MSRAEPAEPDTPLAWPSTEYTQTWDAAVRAHTAARLAEAHQRTGRRPEPGPEHYRAQVTSMVERLANPTIGGLPVQRLRLILPPDTVPTAALTPAGAGEVRRRLDAAAAHALAEQALAAERDRDQAQTRYEAMSSAFAELFAAPIPAGPVPDEAARSRLQRVVDGHWEATGRRQTLALFIARMTDDARARVSVVLRLLFLCAREVGVPDGGGAPPGMEEQIEHGDVTSEVAVPQATTDYQAYPAELPKVLWPVVWELRAYLGIAWNRLSEPERRVVLWRWHGLRLRGQEELSMLEEHFPQPIDK